MPDVVKNKRDRESERDGKREVILLCLSNIKMKNKGETQIKLISMSYK